MNVIVVVANGLHMGFVGAYGNAWIETPNLDRFAAEGVVFDHHFAENLTTIPTRRSWWTGKYGFPIAELGWTPLRHDELILPDVLWDRGIRTAFISDVPMLRQMGHGFGRGFDEVIWVRGAGYDPFLPPGDPRAGKFSLESEPDFPAIDPDDPDGPLWKERWEQVLRNRAGFNSRDEDHQPASRTVAAAIDWLERNASGQKRSRNDPFMLWVDLLAPHGPWDLPEADRDRYQTLDPDDFETGEEGDLVEQEEELIESLEDARVLIDVPAGAVGDALSETDLLRLRRTYAGAVTLLDRRLGDLFKTIARLQLEEDTMVVFTSDQGEPLGEHGYVRRFRPWLYEELIHTPLIIRMPKAERGGERRRVLAQPIDLFPTILSALGIANPPGSHGKDLIPIIAGTETFLRDYACMGMDVEEFAIRTHHWHLIVPIEPDPDDGRGPELYKKPEDRWEQNNVIEAHPDVAEHLELALRRFAEAVRKDELEGLPPLRLVARLGSL